MRRSEKANDEFIRQVYENTENKFGVLWQRLDQTKPEPAWKRKKQPINVGFEEAYHIDRLGAADSGGADALPPRQRIAPRLLQQSVESDWRVRVTRRCGREGARASGSAAGDLDARGQVPRVSAREAPGVHEPAE